MSQLFEQFQHSASEPEVKEGAFLFAKKSLKESAYQCTKEAVLETVSHKSSSLSSLEEIESISTYHLATEIAIFYWTVVFLLEMQIVKLRWLSKCCGKRTSTQINVTTYQINIYPLR